MDTTAELFSTLQDATGLTGLHRYGTDGTWNDYVASGCVWTADSVGSTRVASMTSGVVYINGRRHTVAAVTSRTFTASKDVYVDLLYSTVDNVATPVYTDNTTNAASPALAANSIRLAIVVVGATSIATTASINQGQEDRVLPIASSIPYTVTDSLGNLICPRDPNRKLLGYRQIVTDFTGTQAAYTQITGLSCPVIIPTGRKVNLKLHLPTLFTSGTNNVGGSIWDGTVSGGTQITESDIGTTTATVPTILIAEQITTPSATSKTYNAGYKINGGSTFHTNSGTGNPTYIKVELI